MQATILVDALHTNHPSFSLLEELRLNWIAACKPGSQKTLFRIPKKILWLNRSPYTLYTFFGEDGKKVKVKVPDGECWDGLEITHFDYWSVVKTRTRFVFFPKGKTKWDHFIRHCDMRDLTNWKIVDYIIKDEFLAVVRKMDISDLKDSMNISDRKDLVIWKIGTDRRLFHIPLASTFKQMDFDGKHVALISDDQIEVWNIKKKKVIQQISINSSRQTSKKKCSN